MALIQTKQADVLKLLKDVIATVQSTVIDREHPAKGTFGPGIKGSDDKGSGTFLIETHVPETMLNYARFIRVTIAVATADELTRPILLENNLTKNVRQLLKDHRATIICYAPMPPTHLGSRHGPRRWIITGVWE